MNKLIIKKIAVFSAFAMAGAFTACSSDNTAGVTEEANGIADNIDSSSSITDMPVDISSSDTGDLPNDNPGEISSSSFNWQDTPIIIPPEVSSSSMYTQDNPPVSSSSSFDFSSSSHPPVACKAANAWGGCVIGVDGDYVWKGYDQVYMVETGLDNGSETAGSWFEFNDNENGGGSAIKWPVDKGNSYDEESFDPVIDFCGGMCGEITFDKGSLDFSPFVGIAFSIAGKKEDGTLEPADISNWENICIMYRSDISLTMELGVTDSLMINVLKYDRPKVNLPRNSGRKCFNFSDFKQTGYGEKMAIDEVLKQVTSIEFMFSQPTSSTKTATFYIQAIAIGLKE